MSDFNIDDLEDPKKPRKKRDNKEYHLQVYAFRYLRGTIRKGKNVTHTVVPFPEVEAWHVFQGRKYVNDDDEQAKLEAELNGFYLKELGVLAGVHDMHMIWPNQFATIEFKIGKNDQGPYQRTFTMHMQRCGHRTAVCRTVAQVRDQLIAWGLECKNPVCIEPPRSLEERKAAAFNFYAPSKADLSQ